MQLPYIDQLTAEQLRSPVWVYDIISKRILWANAVAVELWEADDLAALQVRDFSSDQSSAIEQTLLGYLARFERGEHIDLWWEISPNGIRKRVFSRLSGINIHAPEGDRVAMLVEAVHSPELLSGGDIPSAAIAVLFDGAGTIISHNPPFAAQFGDQIDNLSEILPEQDSASFIQRMGSMGRDAQLQTVRGTRWHHAEISIRQEIGGAVVYALTLIDIQERKKQELEIAKEARSDFLTGLMNRRGLMQYMGGLEGKTYTLFYLDLDDFKPVNDTWGHSMGDRLLCQIANILMTQPGYKVCARVGGDEFVVVFLRQMTQQEIEHQATQLLNELAAPHQLTPGCQVRISGSLGVAASPDDGTDIHSLLVNADSAMYEAKKLGRNRFVIYQAGMESWLQRRAQILQHLDEAISNNSLELHFQPIIDGESKNVELVEALLRWHHPELGPLSPLEFIGVAEESGKISRLEHWVVERACQDLTRLRQLYSDTVRISINISGANIVQPDFCAQLLHILAQHQRQPADLLLELTESVLVPVLEQQSPCLQQLVNAGFELAIDDFGTGYSSLAYISQLPARYVKIDRAFIHRLDKDPHTLLFIRDLCHKFGMQCIAEGIEEAPQNAALNDAGIQLQQGYYFARPAALDALITTVSPAEETA